MLVELSEEFSANKHRSIPYLTSEDPNYLRRVCKGIKKVNLEGIAVL